MPSSSGSETERAFPIGILTSATHPSTFFFSFLEMFDISL